MANYLGVSLPTKKNRFCFSLLDDKLNIRTLANGLIEEVLSYASAPDTVYTAISAPSSLNKGLMQKDEYRDRFTPPPPPGRWANLRFVEYELVRERVKNYHTPDSLAACPDWMRKGFDLYEQLEKLDYHPFSTSEAERVWLEVPAEAAFHTMLGKRLRSKSILEGRIQRQLLLWKQGIDVPDPMRCFEEVTRYRLERGVFPFKDIYTPSILQAIAASFIAWLAANHPEKVVARGEAAEGQICLPMQLVQD